MLSPLLDYAGGRIGTVPREIPPHQDTKTKHHCRLGISGLLV